MVAVWVAACGAEPTEQDTSPADGCASHLDCDHDQLCWNQTCEPALDRLYRFTAIGAAVGETNADGVLWEYPLSGAPDMYLVFGLDPDDATARCETSWQDDSYSAAWNHTCEFVVRSDGSFFVTLIDHDPFPPDDLAARWTWSGSSELVELLRTAGENEQSLTDATGEMVVRYRLVPGW